MSAALIPALAAWLASSELAVIQAHKHLSPEFCTVTWGTPRSFDPTAVLEVGDGSGHGFRLAWMRFRPVRERVEVLTVTCQEERKQYHSKWPPDNATVTVKRAELKPARYAALLDTLAHIYAAKVEPISRNSSTGSSANFWVQARLTAGDKMVFAQDWAGYWGSVEEPEFSKPQAAVAAAREAVESVDFRDAELTVEERRWVGQKFARDWAAHEKDSSYWWVRERYLATVGVAGDASALPTLRGVLHRDPKDRCVYHAINAVTRRTGKDVRDKPVEEMDVEKTRRKVLDLIADEK